MKKYQKMPLFGVRSGTVRLKIIFKKLKNEGENPQKADGASEQFLRIFLHHKIRGEQQSGEQHGAEESAHLLVGELHEDGRKQDHIIGVELNGQGQGEGGQREIP